MSNLLKNKQTNTDLINTTVDIIANKNKQEEKYPSPEELTDYDAPEDIDITVSMLNNLVNLSPHLDPFVLYLYNYIEQLRFLLFKIEDIKKSEKGIRKRIKVAEKVLNSFLDSEPIVQEGNEEDIQENMEVKTEVKTEVKKDFLPTKRVANIADFEV